MRARARSLCKYEHFAMIDANKDEIRNVGTGRSRGVFGIRGIPTACVCVLVCAGVCWCVCVHILKCRCHWRFELRCVYIVDAEVEDFWLLCNNSHANDNDGDDDDDENDEDDATTTTGYVTRSSLWATTYAKIFFTAKVGVDISRQRLQLTIPSGLPFANF